VGGRRADACEVMSAASRPRRSDASGCPQADAACGQLGLGRGRPLRCRVGRG
jgi:hypothetical protein